MEPKTKALLGVAAVVIAIAGVLTGIAITGGDGMGHDDGWMGDMPAAAVAEGDAHGGHMGAGADNEWDGHQMQMGAMPGMRVTDRGAMAMDDAAFIAMMIPHHEMAVQMAREELQRGRDRQVRAMARTVIADQRAEIARMRAWYREWFGGDPPAMPMSGAMAMMGMGMDHRAILAADDPDIAFLDGMVPHHAGALLMADMLLAGEPREELAALANDIVSAQSREIGEMQAARERLGG